MRKRRNADHVVPLLREPDRDLAKGLAVLDVCRKLGIAQATCYRWRQPHDPALVDSDRRRRELEFEVDRLKRLVVELLLDKQMLQDIAKKVVSPNQQRAPSIISASTTGSRNGGSTASWAGRSILRYRPSRGLTSRP